MTAYLRFLLIFTISSSLSCSSGVGVESPSRPIEEPQEEEICLKDEAELQHLRTALDRQQLSPLAPLVKEVLFTQGAFKTISKLMLTMARQVEPKILHQVLTDYELGFGLARLSATATAVLSYADADRAQTPADDYLFFDVLSSYMRSCSAHDTVALFRTALVIDYEDENGETINWLDKFLDQLANVMTDPGLSTLLDRIELQDDSQSSVSSEDDTAEILLGRDAFVLLMDLILGNLASPDIDISYFRETMEELLYPQIGDEGTLKANITELLDITFYALESDPFLLPYLQSSTHCLQETDTEKTLGHFIYDLLTLGVLDVEETVDQIRLLKDDAAGTALFEIIQKILDILYIDEGLARDVFQSTAGALAKESSKTIFPQLVILQGSGVIADLSTLLSFLFEQCFSPESNE
jgi:hypothetical protein